MSDLPLTGGCNCGAVRFEVTEPLVTASYCHCKRCQRRSGAAASPSAHSSPGAFRIVAGEDKLRVWKPQDGGVRASKTGPYDQGAEATRSDCQMQRERFEARVQAQRERLAKVDALIHAENYKGDVDERYREAADTAIAPLILERRDLLTAQERDWPAEAIWRLRRD